MPIIVVPVIPRQITPYLVVILCVFQNLHIHIHNAHSLGTAPQSRQCSHERHHDLRQPSIPPPWRPSRVRKHNRCTHVSPYPIRISSTSYPHVPQVFSNARAVNILSRNKASAHGFNFRPASLQSFSVQNVGTMMILAPCAISSRKASGKARSQQMSKPTLPRGVSKTSWTSRLELVRCSRSGPLK